MIEKSIYVADDGEEFTTREECERYERRFEKARSIIFFDEDFNNLHKEKDIYDKVEKAFYMFISNAEDAKEFFNTIGWEMSCSVPTEDLVKDNTIVAYAEDGYCWYNLTEKLEELSKIERKIIGQIYA